MPKHLTVEPIADILSACKDVDGMGTANAAALYAGSGECYPPCTPQAVIELLDHYKIGLEGKNVTVVGRSPVVGKPLAMLLISRNATVTVCHTKTTDLVAKCRSAEILIACAGVAHMIKPEFTSTGQIVIDVGINTLDGKLCGDVDYGAVSGVLQAITPVPGGIGSITTSVLLWHTIQSAIRGNQHRDFEPGHTANHRQSTIQ